jgi:multidrug efflux pump subunit AcrB
MRMPVAAASVALFLPLAGFALLPSLGNSFMPPTDRDMFEVRVWMPSDSSIRNTLAHAHEIEREIRERDEVTRVHWLVGASFPRVYYNLPMDQDGSAHFAHAIVQTRSDAATKRAIDGLQGVLDERFPGAQILVRQFRQGPPVIADVEYRIYGPSVPELIELGERFRRTLQADPEVVVTQATMTRGEPKLWLDADEDRARVAGLALGSVASQLQTSLEGTLGGTMLENLEEVPVRVRYRDERRDDLVSIASTNLVRTQGDGWVPLSALGEIEVRPELAATTRFNGMRANIVKGFTTVEALPINVAERTLARLEEEGFELPRGYRLEIGGTVDQEAEVRGDLMAPLPMIAVLMTAILILTFRSTLLAGILGVIAVMSVGMAVLSTWLLDLPISFNTYMGTFGLIGVALNDSIVVMAEIRANPRAAAGEVEGLVEATIGVTRHVISTTLTTVGGFLPLIVFVGGDFWPSMSIVLAGGIVGASIMALLFIPAAYRLLRRWVAVGRETEIADARGPGLAAAPA